jgi:hypothetical protein
MNELSSVGGINGAIIESHANLGFHGRAAHWAAHSHQKALMTMQGQLKDHMAARYTISTILRHSVVVALL